MLYLGIDTSNYTTSAAVYSYRTGEVNQSKKLLCVKEGELGLRQADAVFQHTLNLPEIVKKVLPVNGEKILAVGVSVSPRDEEGSYMPCFMTGKGTAEIIAAVSGVPIKYFSHQAGHIAAALYSADRMDLLDKQFIAFHVSGGTTEAVKVTPDDKKVFKVEKIAYSLDLKAGQAIDRLGKLLSLPFPSGCMIDRLSLESKKEYKIKPFIRNGCCSLSGLENICVKMKKDGESDTDIARYCIDYITAALQEMTDSILSDYPCLPVVYSGGVMSNTLIRKHFINKYNAIFAADGFSCDNAAGLAVLASI